jgi:hypothetical protein
LNYFVPMLTNTAILALEAFSDIGATHELISVSEHLAVASCKLQGKESTVVCPERVGFPPHVYGEDADIDSHLGERLRYPRGRCDCERIVNSCKAIESIATDCRSRRNRRILYRQSAPREIGRRVELVVVGPVVGHTSGSTFDPVGVALGASVWSSVAVAAAAPRADYRAEGVADRVHQLQRA